MTARSTLIGVAVLALAASACGSSDDSTPVTVTPTTAADAYSTTVPPTTTAQASYSTTTRAAAPATTPPATTAAPVATTIPPTTTAPADTGPRTVTVEAGDSLSQIAKDNGMTLEELVALNAICDVNQLYVGQVLLLAAEDDDTDAEPSEATITVQAGDSLSKIAKRHDTTVEDLMALNDIDDPNTILVGQSLVVVTSATPTPAADPCD